MGGWLTIFLVLDLWKAIGSPFPFWICGLDVKRIFSFCSYKKLDRFRSHLGWLFLVYEQVFIHTLYDMTVLISQMLIISLFILYCGNVILVVEIIV